MLGLAAIRGGAACGWHHDSAQRDAVRLTSETKWVFPKGMFAKIGNRYFPTLGPVGALQQILSGVFSWLGRPAIEDDFVVVIFLNENEILPVLAL